MSMSDIKDYKPKDIATCTNHTTGNGRECSYGVDSENYSQNTLEPSVTVR